jgi:hypothetical protein
MQLILTQTDIEIALIDYANKVITVKDGMSITVELKATRGADGATAIIDISPAQNTPAAKSPEVQTPATAKAEPTKPATKPAATQKPVAASKASEVIEQAASKEVPVETGTEAADELDQVETTNTTPQIDTNEGAEAAMAETAEAEPEAEAEVKTPAKSLFANLRTPRNS